MTNESLLMPRQICYLGWVYCSSGDGRSQPLKRRQTAGGGTSRWPQGTPSLPGQRDRPAALMRAERGENPGQGPVVPAGVLPGKPTVRKAGLPGGNRTPEEPMPAAEGSGKAAGSALCSSNWMPSV